MAGPFLRVGFGVGLSRLGRQKFVPFLAGRNHDDLQTLKELAETGRLRPVVERCYPFAEIAGAIRAVEGGRVRGKVVVTI